MSLNSQKKVVQRKRNNRRKANSYTPSERANDYGRKFSPGPNPPDVTAQPWWPVTISAIRKPGDYTFDHLIKDFLLQVGKGYTFNPVDWNSDKGSPFRIQFRFQKVAVWNLTGRLVSLVVWDIEEITYLDKVHTEKDTLGSWIDCGGVTSFPAVGYNYPSTHHRRVFRPDPRYEGYKILTTSASTDDSILYHIKVEWRSDGNPGPTPGIKYPTAERLIKNLGPRIDKVASAVEKAEKDREESSNSIVKTVVDGVGYTASVVFPVAAAVLPGDATTIASLCSGSLSSFAELAIEGESDIRKDAD